eukprot:141012_1
MASNDDNTCVGACSSKPVLDIYLTIEACSTVICKMHINHAWLWFRVLVTFYITLVFAYSLYYWYVEDKLPYFMAFISNWVLVIQWIYFICASFITHKIYQAIQPKVDRSHSTPSDIDVLPSENPVPAPLKAATSYEFIGKPPDLDKLGLQNAFAFTKSLLEVSLPYSAMAMLAYWITLYSSAFKDTPQAIYYINTHLCTFIVQCIDCYGSTYQLRLGYGVLWILIFAMVWCIWMWLFEELQLENPYTHTNVLYATYNWHENTVQTVVLFAGNIVAVIVLYWFIVWTKNMALIRWNNSRKGINEQLSAGDAVEHSSDNSIYDS